MKCIITSGPMDTKIDNVRSMLNSSTGNLGSLFADTCSEFYEVVYVHTSGATLPNNKNIKTIEINTPKELVNHINNEMENKTIVIHLMAIRDFYFKGNVNFSKLLEKINKGGIKDEKELLLKIEDSLDYESKLSSKNDQLLYFKKDLKVIDEIKKINKNAFLVGFKLLSNVTNKELLCVQKELLKRSSCDVVVGNIKEEINSNQHKAQILYKDEVVSVNNKEDIVREVLSIIRRDYE